MESIKNSLKHDYNLAVDCFNRSDYVSFFRNIRPAIEWICKLIICDVIANKITYDDLIQGRKTVSKSYDEYRLTTSNNKKRPTGSSLAILMPKVYFYKHPEVYSAIYDINKKATRTGIESYGKSFEKWYSVASEIGNHTGSTSMDMETQAQACASSFPSFFDFLKANNSVSEETLLFLNQFNKFAFTTNKDEVSEVRKQIQEKEEQILKKEKTIEEQAIKISEQDATLLLMREQLAEVEKTNLESLDRTNNIEQQLIEKQNEIDQLKAQLKEKGIKKDTSENENGKQSIASSKNKLSRKLSISQWNVDEDSMDYDQLDIIDYTIDKSMLVAGCAGSGKSVIAMHKAEQLAKAGYDVILIAYTKSLNGFMETGYSDVSHYKFFYHYQWKYQHNMPSADYIIVDEIQDFEKPEIEEFIKSAKKHYLFFGDTAQSIYKQFGKNTMSIEQISEMTGLKTLRLYNNYRLPRPVAKITQNYVGVDVMPYSDKVYMNKENALPHFVKFPDLSSQVSAIVNVIQDNPNSSIGIFLPTNNLVKIICEKLHGNKVSFEYKFQIEKGVEREVHGNLDFTTNLPKVMTYHSAKGLQFDIVILPMYNGAPNIETRKSLYVAMTRTMHELFVFYDTPELLPPLSKVPTLLYKKE